MKAVSAGFELKRVLFELLGILISDGEFDDSEKEFLSQVRTSFGISQDECDEMLKLLYEYLSLYQKIVATVL